MEEAQQIQQIQQIKEQFRMYGGSTPAFSLQGQKLYGRVVSIYDGDTMTLVLPVFQHYFKYNVRLMGIDTCEMKSKSSENKDRAHQARNAVFTSLGIPVHLSTRKDIQKYLQDNIVIVSINCGDFDKYGRLLGDVFAMTSQESLSEMLIRLGLAYRYYGETKLTEDQQEKAM